MGVSGELLSLYQVLLLTSLALCLLLITCMLTCICVCTMTRIFASTWICTSTCRCSTACLLSTCCLPGTCAELVLYKVTSLDLPHSGSRKGVPGRPITTKIRRGDCDEPVFLGHFGRHLSATLAQVILGGCHLLVVFLLNFSLQCAFLMLPPATSTKDLTRVPVSLACF